MKKIIIILFFILITGIAFGQNKFELSTFERDSEMNLKFHKFYFVHYMYYDFLLPLNISNILTLDTKKRILKNVYSHLKEGYQKELKITSIEPVNLRIRLKPFIVKSDKSLIVYTNYDVSKKKLVPINSAPDNFYAKQYYILNNKLVPSDMFYNRKGDAGKIKKLKMQKKYNKLADYLLYDSSSANDKNIPIYLKQGLAQKIPLGEKIIMKLTLLEYNMMINNYSKCNVLINDIEKSISKIKDMEYRSFIQGSLKRMKEIKEIIEYIN